MKPPFWIYMDQQYDLINIISIGLKQYSYLDLEGMIDL
jgi:hypothetical protein